MRLSSPLSVSFTLLILMNNDTKNEDNKWLVTLHFSFLTILRKQDLSSHDHYLDTLLWPGNHSISGCDSFLYSCCKSPDLGTSRKEKDYIEKRWFISSPGDSCHRKWSRIVFRKQEFLDHEPECGVSRHRQFSKRIIGGEKAKFSELPWQAHIRSVQWPHRGLGGDNLLLSSPVPKPLVPKPPRPNPNQVPIRSKTKRDWGWHLIAPGHHPPQRLRMVPSTCPPKKSRWTTRDMTQGSPPWSSRTSSNLLVAPLSKCQHPG